MPKEHPIISPKVFKGDKWNRLLGTRIPIGSMVEVVRYFTRRRVLIRYNGELINTMLWCLSFKRLDNADTDINKV